MKQPIIQVKNLVAAYDDRIVLDKINLDIYPGESMIILGRSGCGKSTLLRHLIGLAEPADGQILIRGRDITTMGEEERVEILKNIGMLFQSAALFNSMTVGDNVAFPLRAHTDLNESTIQIMIKMKLQLVGLAGFDKLKPAQLSGGMKKRAGLARAIAMDPEILFCDEPSAGLDPIVAAGIDNLILKLKKAFEMTIVVVTHELESVYIIADRIAMMHEGKIIAVGTKEELQTSTHPIVQQFLNRQADDEKIDREKHLNSIVG
jgi:phospholipid/cholesterol/gamma-HCH transport system ATP-binding protein